MKTAVLLACLLITPGLLPAQSTFDPVVHNQLQQLKEEQEAINYRLRTGHDRPPDFPPPPSAHFRYSSGAYERAIAKYEAEIRARGIKLDAATEAKLDDAHRRIAGVSVGDWEKRKPQNDPFTNGFFKRPTPAQRFERPAMTPVPVVQEDDPVMASRIRAGKRYPQFADPNSPLTKKYVEISARLRADDSWIIHSPTAAEVIADMAAKELGIKPAGE